MITCSYLRAYDTGKLTQKATDTTTQADTLEQTADAVETQAAAIAAAWPDPTGQLAVAALKAYAQALRAESERIAKIAPILTTAAGEIDAAKMLLATADANDAANQYVTSDDFGRVTFTAAFHQLTDDRRPEQYTNRTMLQHEYFLALDAATKADEKAAIALYALRGQHPPFQPRPDTGPVDLSDEAIADQLATSQQGQYGDCYFLTSLASIANADPQFIRDHITWDPATGLYTVTIYENAVLGVVERQITVDPTQLDLQNATTGPDGRPNFLTIYEAAYRQTVHGSIFTNTGGVPSAAMLAITGQQADFTVTSPASFTDIQGTLNGNPPGAVAVATNPGFWPWPDPASQPYEDRIVPKHAYWVKGFDEQGRIILVNSWGPDGGTSGGVDYPGEVHLTEEEFRALTMQTSRTVP